MIPDERGRGVEGDGRDGDEPDYRFTLANERTYLAWIRTSLALLAGGVAVRYVGDEDEGGRTAIAVAAVAVSAVSVVLSYRRWSGVQRAMRRGEPLPASVGVAVLAVAVVGVAIGAAIVVLLG